MKECPACGGQVRPSVVRCVHCGASLVEQAKAPGMLVGGRGVKTEPSQGTHRAGRVAASSGVASATVPGPTTTPGSQARPEPAGGARQGPLADVWAIPSAENPAPEPFHRAVRSTRRSRRVDLTLMIAGGVELGAAVFAYLAIATPWVRAQITADERSAVHVAGRLIFGGSDSPAATATIIVTGLLALLGVMWFWYGLDRGVHLPAFAHPALAVVASLTGLAIALVARIGSVLWQQAFVEHARLIGASKDAMRRLLGLHPPPSIGMHQLGGLLRFTVMMLVALGAASAAWWTQRSRA